MDAIVRAERLGWALLLLTVAIALIPLLLVQVRQALGRVARWGLVFPLVHPGWWLGARGGDCGYTRLLASLAVTLLATVVVIGLTWRGHTTRHPAE
jgi:hypothetical protein